MNSMKRQNDRILKEELPRSVGAQQMATGSSILAWRIPWTEEVGGLQSTGCKESDTTEWNKKLNIMKMPILPN